MGNGGVSFYLFSSHVRERVDDDHNVPLARLVTLDGVVEVGVTSNH